MLCEIGGTVGDIEGLPFFEAIRQLGNDLPRGHCGLHPPDADALHPGGGRTEDQADAAFGQGAAPIGIQPDILLVPRRPAESRRASGGSSRCSATCAPTAVIQALDVATIYDVPVAYHHEGLDDEVLAAFGITDAPPPDLARWETIVARHRQSRGRGDDRHRRQVHRAQGRLQVADRGAVTTAASPTR